MIRSSSKGGATLCGFKIAIVAEKIGGLANHFIADIGGGSMALVAYEHPELALGSPSALTFQSYLMEAVSGGLVTDHRRAVESYARIRLSTPVSPIDEQTLELHFDDGIAKIKFDDENRLSDFSASLGGQK